MSEQLKESLSAVMDDEADAFELRRVLDEARADPELREQWHRLHLLRDVLRQDMKSFYPGLRGGLRHALDADEDLADDAEPIHLVATGAGKRRATNWTGRLLGTAVASLVAVLVVVNGDLFVGDQPANLAGTVQAIPGVPLSAPVMYDQATDQDRQRLDALRMHHYQNSALNRVGTVPFVRMATFGRTVAPVRKATRVEEPQPASVPE